MATVEMDLDGLLARLHEREYHSVPFQVVPVGRGVDMATLLAKVRDAAHRAYELSLQRHPFDPTTPYEEPSIAKRSLSR